MSIPIRIPPPTPVADRRSVTAPPRLPLSTYATRVQWNLVHYDKNFNLIVRAHNLQKLEQLAVSDYNFVWKCITHSFRLVVLKIQKLRNKEDVLQVTCFANHLEMIKIKCLNTLKIEWPMGLIQHYSCSLDTQNDEFHIIQEYAAGGSLAQQDSSWWDEDEIIALIIEIGTALNCLHYCGYAHMDIHPGNVVRSWDTQSNRYVYKLIDLGSMCPVGPMESFVYPKVFSGAGVYGAPEVVQNGIQSISSACDVYSLGATVYYIWTGSTPPTRHDSRFNGIIELEVDNKPPLNNQLARFIQDMLSIIPGQRPSLLSVVTKLVQQRIDKREQKEQREQRIAALTLQELSIQACGVNSCECSILPNPNSDDSDSSASSGEQPNDSV